MTHITNQISGEAWRALIHSEVQAIVIDDILSAEECDRACRVIRQLTSSSTYRWSSDLTVIGTSVGEAHESPETEERYFANAEATAALLREVVFPFGSPVSRMIQRMLFAWPGGVAIPTKNGRPFLPEIVRRWVEGGGAHPHIDQVATPLLAPLGIGRRIGFNAYLSMPESGGAIEFWNRKMSDEEYVRMKRPDYGLDRNWLGAADLTLRPKRGQAVLFRAWEPHAVEAVSGSRDRITNATFLCADGPDRPMFQFA